MKIRIFASELTKKNTIMAHFKEEFFPSVEDFYSTRMKTRDQMLHDKKLAARYLDILKQASNLHVKGKFLEHGVTMCCANPVGGILITGINPSDNPKAPKGCYYTFEETMLNPIGSYWRNKKKQIVGDDAILIRNTAYLDLFPYSESSQKTFLSEIENKDNNNEFQVKVLEITLEEIEYLSPKLIIAANKQTSYYWGIKEDCIWLGYNLIEVEESHKPECIKGTDIRFYRIEGETGFKEAKDRIGQDRFPNSINGRSNLLGSYFIDYALYDDRHVAKYPSRILNPSIIKELYEFITR